MENKKIVIAGGSGFIGEEMTKYFSNTNQIIILTREINNAQNNRNYYNTSPKENLTHVKFVRWDGKTSGEWVKELEGADLLINLSGKTVNCRYNEKNKKEILNSRIYSTKVLGEAIQQCAKPPILWINSSSATIYRHAEDRPQDENTGEFHDGFSVQVCKLWEKAFYEQFTPHTRKVALRMAITLGSGGVLIPYFNLLKLRLGGKQGSGKQMYSWIHIEDTCRMIEWIFKHTNMEGTYNCCSPNPVMNKEFMQTLRQATGYKIGLPAAKWMLKIGAAIIGTETELILKSRWVLPTKIVESGFEFKYSLLKDAFKEIISKVPRKHFRLF